MKSRPLPPLLRLVLTVLAFTLACVQQETPPALPPPGTPGVGATAVRGSDAMGTDAVESETTATKKEQSSP